MISKKDELSDSSAAYVSCSTYSGLTQNEIQFQIKQSSVFISKDMKVSEDTEDDSDASVTSKSTCLRRTSSRILRSYPTEGKTYDSIVHKDSETNMDNTENQIGQDALNSMEDMNDRTSAGNDTLSSENKEKTKTPVRAKHKRRTSNQSLHFLNRMIKSKRQAALAEEYKQMFTVLHTLMKQQQKAPIKSKKDRIRRKLLIKRIRSLFRELRKKLKKRDRLQRILTRKRAYKERQRKVHNRLKKILRVVYFKRQQRIENMRDLRINERRRLADNLMLQAAKLRARANRLTGGREVKHAKRKVKKASKMSIPKEGSLEIVGGQGDQNEEKNSQIVIKASMQKMPESESQAKKLKKHRGKLRKQKSLDKHAFKTKLLDGKLKNLNEHMKSLLKKLSKIGKKHKNPKLISVLSTLKTTLPIAITTNDKALKKLRPRKRKYRKPRQAWWRKDRLKAAKIKREKPKDDINVKANLALKPKLRTHKKRDAI